MPRTRATRSKYAVFSKLSTRWSDNDAYGHMNNVVYYELVDTVVNVWLRDAVGMKVPGGDVIGLVERLATPRALLLEMGFVQLALERLQVGGERIERGLLGADGASSLDRRRRKRLKRSNRLVAGFAMTECALTGPVPAHRGAFPRRLAEAADMQLAGKGFLPAGARSCDCQLCHLRSPSMPDGVRRGDGEKIPNWYVQSIPKWYNFGG